MTYKINNANIKDWAANYDGELFDGILCDPPYELGFMGKSWDSSGIAFDVEMWQNIYKLLKPGAHLLAFSGSRTYHRMAVAIEDAGFEIRDMIEWVYGSGFPKSLNVSKAIEAKEKYGKTGTRTLRQVEQDGNGESYKLTGKNNGILGETKVFDRKVYTPQGSAIEWSGYGTALKPAHEPCVLARKPIEGNVANNCLKHGVGGLAIDKTRIKTDYNLQRNDLVEIIRVCQLDRLLLPASSVELKKFQDDTTNAIKSLYFALESVDTPISEKTTGIMLDDIIKKITSCLEETLTENTNTSLNTFGYGKKPMNKSNQKVMKSTILTVSKMITDWKISSSSVLQLIEALHIQAKTLKTTSGVQGRFPSNLIHNGSDEVEAVFPQSNQSTRKYGVNNGRSFSVNGGQKQSSDIVVQGDKGSASRFFYTAKASKSERNAGLDGFEVKEVRGGGGRVDQGYDENTQHLKEAARKYGAVKSAKQNIHPTVKPLALTKYLATLIKPPKGGRLLVPFSGSGSEMIGALQAGWGYVEGVELTEEYIPIAEARIKYWLEQADKQGRLV